MKTFYKPAALTLLALTALASFWVVQRCHFGAEFQKTVNSKKPVSHQQASSVVPENTLADIRNSIARQEYNISYDEKKKMLQSPNRQQNLRAYYKPGKLSIKNRVDTAGHNFQLELINEGILADGRLIYKSQANAKTDNKDNKLLIDHHQFIEEYINNEDGVRQNFIINEAPEGTKQLQVMLSAKGLKVRNGATNELQFYTENKKGETENKLVYNDLKCWDANKKPLSASLAYVNNHIEINVDAENAAYPVTIDPIIVNGNPQNSNKVIEINQSNMWLGFSVSSAGDVNGDGYSDIIAGAPQYDKGQTNEGAAFIYPGSPSGLTLNAVTLECNQNDAKMGYSVASAGDFNGDGFSDVIVGIPYYDAGANGTVKDVGIAKLYFGSAQGISANSTPKDLLTGHPSDYYGISVATAGDIDADGYSDILVGVLQNDYYQNNAGTVLIFYGAPTNYKGVSQLGVSKAEARFGYSVAPAGDVDADGFSDIIVGARFYSNGVGHEGEGAAFIYRGSAGGIIDSPVVIEGDQYDAAMGNKVSSAGDVNGDGYSDILLSAFMYDNQHMNEGRVYLHLGSSTGINPTPERIFEGDQTDARIGASVACAGDVNGDGYSDILLGSQYFDNGQNNEGAVFVYHGSKDGVVGTWASMLESNQVEGWFGTAVASAGDVNGDGYSDIIIGCYTFDNGQNDEGMVYIYHGGAEGVGIKDALMATNNKVGAQMGLSVASAGDVNGDGYDDVVVGAPYFDEGQSSEGVAFVYSGSINGLITNTYTELQKDQANAYFGGSVAGAGDVNGDGYDDVIIGAKEYTSGQSNEGVVFFYPGSSSGIDQNMAPYMLQQDKGNADFGFAVAGAGDINRDGYGDIVVGAPTMNPQGSIYVYLGGLNGPTNPTVIHGFDNPPQYADLYFGSAVSTAGDVNGDGYSDIIIGAYGANSGQQGEGMARIYHGSSSGINPNYAKILQSNQIDANFGFSVASAGDVNGDGYSDVIIGSRYHDNGQSNEGVAMVYYGSTSGITDAIPAPTLLEANTAGAYFGWSVNGAGDVNGDGYSDVIVGAPNFANGQSNEGNVFVFHGSPNGVKTTSAFSNESNLLGSFLGKAVSGAGDVNGDGYSDVLVGANGYDNGQYADAGAAFVYYGNNGKGLRNNVRLYNSGLVGPYDHNQFNQQNFGLGLFVKSFIGRNKARLVWETRANGNAFSSVPPNPITTSTAFTGEIANLTNLPMIGAERSVILTKMGTATKVRVRIRYSPALAITGQMYGPWRYVQRQLAGYNNAPVPEEAMAETIKRKAFAGLEGQNSITLYPNPVSDRFFIKSENLENIRSLRLLTTGGKLVYQTQTPTKEVDVKNLDAGMYILLVTQQDGSQTSHKVVVRK
jgi:hypothetical protein